MAATAWNIGYALLALGFIDEADRAADTLARIGLESDAIRFRLRVLLARERWASADSLAASQLGDPRLQGFDRSDFWLGRCWARSAMGEFRGATHAAAVAARDAASAKDQPRLERSLRAQVILAEVAPYCRTDLPHDLPGGHTYTQCITTGLLRATAGDLGGAQEWLGRAGSAPDIPKGWEDDGRVLLEAWIASSQRGWSRAAELLGPASLRGYDFPNGPMGTHALNWFRGRAFENCGRPDSGIACYERTLVPGPTRGYACRVPARIRLVELYAARGDLESARRHWNVLVRDVTNPDSELRPMLSQAHAALASAEAMARPTKQ